jgi:hypothetical protein
MAITQHIFSGTRAYFSFATAYWTNMARRALRALVQPTLQHTPVITQTKDTLRVTIAAQRGWQQGALLVAATLGLCIGANRVANTLVCNVGVDLSLWLPGLLPVLALTYMSARVLIDRTGAVLGEETLIVDPDGISRLRSFAGLSLHTRYPAETVQNLHTVDAARPIAFDCAGELRCGTGLRVEDAQHVVAAITRLHPHWSTQPAEPALLDAPNLESLPDQKVDSLVAVYAVG